MTPNQREMAMVHHGIISGAVIITLASQALSNASTFLKQKKMVLSNKLIKVELPP